MTKKLILFLPYKVSMWDSLESIYQAASQDPECEALVMPVPYFVNKSQYAREQFCEAKLFPSHLKVIDYKKYNLAKTKPYAIYIHNAYDQGNAVTEINQAYSTHNLKKYTANLIYVPYCLVSEKSSEDFVKNPSFNNISKIIAMSEGAKKNFARFNPESKILPLGSPKADAIKSMLQNPPQIPEEWKERAAGKTTVFYNTTISCLMRILHGSPCKLEKVFEYFSKKTDALLIWRPHPLSKECFQTIAKEELGKYNALVKKYKEENIGIFDDTPSFHAAFALSDLYYGDKSSLVSLYGLTGKPIMLQSYYAKAVANSNLLSQIDNYIYFCHNECNALFAVDLNNENTNFLGSFPDEALHRRNLYRNPLPYGNKLLFCPNSADSIGIYAPQSGEISTFQLPILAKPLAKGIANKFIGFAVFGNSVFFFGYRYSGILELNLVTMEFSRHLEKFYFHNYLCAGNKAYLVANKFTKIIEFSFESKLFNIIDPPIKEEFSLRIENSSLSIVPKSVAPLTPPVKKLFIPFEYFENEKISCELFSHPVNLALNQNAFIRTENFPVLSLDAFIKHINSANALAKEQISAFNSIFANSDGTAGEKIHNEVMGREHNSLKHK
jgi:hypothetical protein